MDKKPEIYYTRMNCASAYCEANKNPNNYRCIHCEEFYKKHDEWDDCDDETLPDFHHGYGSPHHWN